MKNLTQLGRSKIPNFHKLSINVFIMAGTEKINMYIKAHNGNMQNGFRLCSISISLIQSNNFFLMVYLKAPWKDIHRGKASLLLPGGQYEIKSLNFLHFPLVPLIFPQIFFNFLLILVFILTLVTPQDI